MVIRHGNTLPNSRADASQFCHSEPIIQRVTAILQVALMLHVVLLRELHARHAGLCTSTAVPSARATPRPRPSPARGAVRASVMEGRQPGPSLRFGSRQPGPSGRSDSQKRIVKLLRRPISNQRFETLFEPPGAGNVAAPRPRAYRFMAAHGACYDLSI